MDDIRNVFDSSEDEAEVEIINNDQKEEGEYVTMDETQPACTMCGRNSANDLEDITEKELGPEMEPISDSEIEVEPDTGDKVFDLEPISDSESDLEDKALTRALDAHTQKVESILQQMVIKDEDEYKWNRDTVPDSCEDWKGYNIMIGIKEIDIRSLPLVADKLFKVHLRRVCGAAWENRLDMVVWIDLPMDFVQDLGTKRIVDTVWKGAIKKRSFTCTSLKNETFGLSPHFNQFRLLPGRFWEEIGFRYEETDKIMEECFPELRSFINGPVRYLRIDSLKTLQRPYRERLLAIIDGENLEKEKLINQLMIPDGEWIGTICRAYTEEEAIGTFPHLFRETSYQEVRDSMKRPFCRATDAIDMMWK